MNTPTTPLRPRSGTAARGPSNASREASSATFGSRNPTGQVRVAIYTRKSVAKGLDQEFNSIDAQRAAVEAFVTSQAHLRWRAMPERYDDGGFSGATTDRPALARLMADVEYGRVDVVAVYKIDRLSRSLVDFANLTRTLEQRGVGLVSVTQQFNTATSMGKLTLNILMSFAEFEREVISERTADKVAASRRRGLWTGGRPPLGYDSVGGKLVVNAREAERVRAIFQAYLDAGSITETIAELRRRGWTNKAWRNARGEQTGGGDFVEQSVRTLLTNQLYVGRMRAGDAHVRGAHQAIVDEDVFRKVAELLERRRAPAARRPKVAWDSLLGGMVTCGRCGRSMGHAWSARGARRYRYYVCQSVQKAGAKACPGSRAPAAQLEEVVIARVRAIGSDPQLVAEVTGAIADTESALLPAARERVATLERERKGLEDRMARMAGALRAAEESGDAGLAEAAAARVDDALAALVANQREVEAAHGDVAACERAARDGGGVDAESVRAALEEFDAVWEEMTPAERGRVVRALVERVTCDVVGGEVRIEFSADGARRVALEGRNADPDEDSPVDRGECAAIREEAMQ